MNIPSSDEIRAGRGAPRARDGGGAARRGRSGAPGWWLVVVAIITLVVMVVAVVVVVVRALSRPARSAAASAPGPAPAAPAGPAAESGGAPAAAGGAGGPVRAMGHNRTCTVSSGGVECAGRGADGEMAVQEVSGFDAPVAHLGVGSAGFATAVDSSGGVWVWGDADGAGGAAARRLGALPGRVVGGVVAGALHACAVVDESGKRSVWCWGSDQWGQVSGAEGAGEVAPTRAAGVAGDAESVDSSDYDTCATTSEGVWCWGLNAWGTLDKDSGARILAPTRIGADGAGDGGAR